MGGGRSIRLRILGSAAGGGLPQWNCSCANCLAARTGKIASQTQSSVAISGDDRTWFLINASPDLARQIESTPALQPRAGSARNSPIGGVLLTNADIDHALGLLLLRQRETPLLVYPSDETRSALAWIDAILEPFCGIKWQMGESKLDRLNRSSSIGFVSLGKGLAFRVIDLGSAVAFQIRDEISGGTALVAPAVSEITPELRDAAYDSDVVLFDGTFWSDDELRAIRPGARSAREMNHLPISAGSLEFLRHSPARRKVYTHINNTNPIYMPGSAERTQVEQAGIEIACDGMEIIL